MSTSGNYFQRKTNLQGTLDPTEHIISQKYFYFPSSVPYGLLSCQVVNIIFLLNFMELISEKGQPMLG